MCIALFIDAWFAICLATVGGGTNVAGDSVRVRKSLPYRDRLVQRVCVL